MTTEQPEASSEVETLQPESGPLVLSSGTEILVERLRTRQLFRFLKILTRGAGPILQDLDFASFEDDPGTFVTQLLGSLVIAVPEAESETVDFIQSMVSPTGLVEGRRISKRDAEINDQLIDDLRDELENPEIEDMFLILERVIRVETPEVMALGKRLAVLLNAQKTATQAKASSKPESSSRKSSKS